MIGNVAHSHLPMKHDFHRDDPTRFKGRLRHYHRAGAPGQRSWDDWVYGEGGKKRGGFLKWLRITGIALAILILLAIIVGLIIELR